MNDIGVRSLIGVTGGVGGIGADDADAEGDPLGADGDCGIGVGARAVSGNVATGVVTGTSTFVLAVSSMGVAGGDRR